MQPARRSRSEQASRNDLRTAPAQRGGGARFRALVWRLVKLGALGLVALMVLAALTYLYFDRHLPSVDALRSYRPPQVSKVLCVDGTQCAEFFRERRTWIDLERLPPYVKNAFLAAEDADFYKHQGLDYVGMARAALKSLIPGQRATGASTITQQACRNLLLSQERTLSRKIKEWILTPRMERALTKDQILSLYLNQIYYGHNRYGIEEAALFYFGKSAKDLSVGEAAVLAGIPQLPDRINPVTNIVKAKRRQKYVLTQMGRQGFLPEKAVQAELERPIVLAPRPPAPVGPYYTEELRRMLVARYGDRAVLEGGLRVQVAMHPVLQAAADTSLQAGLEAVDRRMGYRGALGKLEPARFTAVRPLVERRMEEAGKRRGDQALVADLSPIAAETTPGAPADEGAEVNPESGEGEDLPSADEVLARRVVLRPLREGLRLGAFVKAVDDRAKRAEVDLVGRTAHLPFSSASWARPRGVGKWTAAPNRMSDVVKVGDIVRVRVGKVAPAPAPLEVTLDQVPEVQGALVAIDPATRHVVAMSGGYDFALSAFNRATQASRQPGSAFKPFVYGAALASQKFTPLSIVNDAPEAIRDPYTGKTWKPQNFEKGDFEGPMTLRAALTKSKNTVSVRLIEALTPQVAIDFGQRAGVRSPMPDNFTLALGTGEVTVLELTNAYTTLQSLGKFAEPILVLKVMDAEGKVLEEHQAAFEETLPPAVAYLSTSLMRSVVEEGTATAVQELARPAAGKTGTASEYRDAWFAGYTADLVATAWVGFDKHDSLGQGETGGRAALPIWLSFMKVAHQDLPVRDFEVPAGVTLVRVDPSTGLLAGGSVPGRVEPFLDGTAPTSEAPPPGQVSPDQFFLQEGKRGRGL